MKRRIDKQERTLIKELILTPRISDNQIARNTNIPLKTVNRKRKKLEEEGLLQYFTHLDASSNGTGDFSARQQYIITFRYGISRKMFLDKVYLSDIAHIATKHIYQAGLGEDDGCLVLFLILESRNDTDILEIFNEEIMPFINSKLGNDCIKSVKTINVTHMLRLLHNYIPKGKKHGPGTVSTDSIFVTDQ